MPGEPAIKGRRPLRRTVLLAFVPLAVALFAASVAQWSYARAVHEDIQRLFEELREIAVVRALIDEIRGIEPWMDAAPPAGEEALAIVRRDVGQHLAAALGAVRRLQAADDPSRAAHEQEEHRLVDQILGELQRMQDRLRDGGEVAGLREPLLAVRHAAASLAAAIERESRSVGDDLDQRSDAMRQLLLLLGATGLATLALLGWSLLQRVLRPVEDLRAAAARLGQGELDAEIPRRRDDELGDLAGAFRAMAKQIRAHQSDLEERVAVRTQEALRSARLAQLGTLAAGVAHEINNPLASIVAAADGLLREARSGASTPSADVEYLEILRKEALRAKDITARLLRFARQDNPRREPFDLAVEAREVGALFRHQLAEAGVALDLTAETGRATILGDAAAWRQVLFNLVRNALDASPKVGRIRIAIDRADGRVRLAVEDDGPGIPPAERQRVFEPFVTTKEPGRGTGLGLAIVHRVVEAHGGRVFVDDSPRGARIVVEAPGA
jgi:signal transduction histidine kinase